MTETRSAPKSAGRIAVIGAAGNTGRPLMQALLRRGVSPRAILRDAARASALPGVSDVAVADIGDRSALVKALQNIDVVHFIPPLYQASEEPFAASVIAAAAEARVGRLTYHSVLHAHTPAMPHHVRKARIEIMIRDSALAWTIVQPAMYTSTPLRFFDAARAALEPPFSLETQFNPIDPTDLADAVAAVLVEDGHDFATYELAGAERLNFRRMGEIISAVLKRPMIAQSITPDVALARRPNFDAAMQVQARAMYAQYDAHGLPGNGKVLKMILKRDATTFADSMRRQLV